jgi:NAD(P) transhydrogenase subunit alpha
MSQAVSIAVPKEIAPGERRVALVPDAVARLVKAGFRVTVERGAGSGARIPDEAYASCGATLGETPAGSLAGAQVVLKVRAPEQAEATLVSEGSTLIGFCQPERDAEALAVLHARRVTVLSMDYVPRVSRAQSMDALSSQASVAGYEAVLLGASHLVKFMPMLVTAAGTLPPATVLVLGAGVAGLTAIATARRLGAIVRAYDIRPEVKEEIESLGAAFVAAEAVSEGARTAQGYAKEVGEDVRQRQEAALARHVAEADLVISTAQVFGAPAPTLISEAMVERMRPGAVIMDVAAETGGNCALTRPGDTVEHHGVTILGPLNLPSLMPLHASQMYARNVSAVLNHVVRDGRLDLNRDDEIVRAMLVVPAGGR